MQESDSMDDAVDRLVHSIVGAANASDAKPLVDRMVHSQIGGRQERIDVPGLMRRIDRKLRDPESMKRVEHEYAQLSGLGDDEMAPKLMAVLTKLVGKNIPSAPPSEWKQASSRRATDLPEGIPHRTSTRQAAPVDRRSGRAAHGSSPSGSARSAVHTLQQPSVSQRTPYLSSANVTNKATIGSVSSTSRHTIGSVSSTSRHTIGRETSPSIGTHSQSPLRQKLVHRTVNIPPPSPPPAKLRHGEIEELKTKVSAEEATLLRECLYSLQGIDGERIRFYRNPNVSLGTMDFETYQGIRVQSFALDQNLLYSGHHESSRLGTGALDALRICGEAGWLYQLIQDYIRVSHSDGSKGVVARAFAGNLGQELKDYHALLTKLEHELHQITLRQLLVDLRQPMQQLKILAMLTDSVSKFSGGHLLGALYKHSIHGDTRHTRLVKSLLQASSMPWFDMLYRWTTQGVLSDPHDEFFVTEVPNVDDKHLWKEKYRVNRNRFPIGIMSQDLIKPVFSVGKGINFIRRCLHDGRWSMDLSGTGSYSDPVTTSRSAKSIHDRGTSEPTDIEAFQQTVLNVSQQVHSYILKAIQHNHHLFDHLLALKQFLFMGQGDFFSALMDGLASEFQGQSGIIGIYKHTLLSLVEVSLRSTNAKFMPADVLDRVQVELLVDPDDDNLNRFAQPLDSGAPGSDSRTVWDIFMLDYTVPDPLVAIVHPAAMDQYKYVFSLLFRIKKVEYMLNSTWRHSASLQHALHMSAQHNMIDLSTSAGYNQASLLLRHISITRQSMTHFVNNFKSYLMLEVVEGGWKRLNEEILSAQSLDEVIEAHDHYLASIVRRSLLRATPSEENFLADQVQVLLDIVNDFCHSLDGVLTDSLQKADEAAYQRLEAERRLRQGRWGYETEQTEDEAFFGLTDVDLLREVIDTNQSFNDHSAELLRLMNEKVNGNPEEALAKDSSFVSAMDASEIDEARQLSEFFEEDLEPQRFLSAQLDHNNFYGVESTIVG